MLNELLQSLSRAPQAGLSAFEQQSLLSDYTKKNFLLFAFYCAKEQDARAFDLAKLANFEALTTLHQLATKKNRRMLASKVIFGLFS